VSRVRDAAALAEELAFWAQHLRQIAQSELAAKGDLHGLYRSFKEGLETDQTEDQFADALAQTLTYVLLSARWLSKDEPEIEPSGFNGASALKHFPTTSPLLKDLFKTMLDLSRDPKFGGPLDEIAALLDRTDVAEIFTGLPGDPVTHFYEAFLEAYDPAARRDRGVYYTPEEIVRFMVRCADALLKENGAGGLSAEDTTVLDISSGTGSFLSETLEVIASTPNASSRALIDRIRGFEIMVAPYAICHLRLALLLERFGIAVPEGARVNVVLTDTLTLPGNLDLFSRPFAAEVAAGHKLKAPQSAKVVFGNPPYRNNSNATLAQMARRFPALLESSRAAAKARERNIRDDYAWFFAAADHSLRPGGVLCFITSDSYLKKQSYALFRAEVLRRYKIHAVIRLGEDVFANVGPRIGFAIIAMSKLSEPADPTAAEVPFLDISAKATAAPPDSLAADPRLQWLARTGLDEALAGAVSLRPSVSSGFQLLPVARGEAFEASRQIVTTRGTRHEPLFFKKWPGLITAFDALFRAPAAEALAARMTRFFAAGAGDNRSASDALARDLGLDEDARERLWRLCQQSARDGIQFSWDRIKRICSGSIPDELRWYPPRGHWEHLYFDARFQIPRNVNPGKATGWGWMQQWRPPETHEQFPKLIFTTSTNKKYGFRAFVVSDRWYAKLHGAASQQYHYVTAVDPTKGTRENGSPNNLAEGGQRILEALRALGMAEEDLLHVIAAFYNSSYGAGYAAREEEPMLVIPDVSGSPMLASLARLARDLRDLHLVLNEVVLPAEEGAPGHREILKTHSSLLCRAGLLRNGARPARVDLLRAAKELQRELDEIVNQVV
jgi:hypothetical protein